MTGFLELFSDIQDSGMRLKVRNKVENFLRDLSSHTTLKDILCSMFVYDNLPVNFNRFLDKYLNECGMAVATDVIDGELDVFPCSPCGELDKHGMPITVLASARNEQVELTVGEDCVICYNTKSIENRANPDICYYADTLSETDLSILYLLRFSRLNPLPVVANSKDKQKIEDALNKVMRGDMSIITLDTQLEYLLSETKNYIQKLDLLNPDATNNLNYLSQFYDVAFSRFLCKYGLPTQFQGKMAQMSQDEIQGYQAYSRVMPYQMLEQRELFVKGVNENYGTNGTVDFSKAFKHLKSEISHVKEGGESVDIIETEEEIDVQGTV